MGSLPTPLVERLRRELELERAVETGTYGGGTARLLAGLFASVTTIELSPQLHRAAANELADLPNVECLLGDSPGVLRSLADPPGGTLYWLDAHCSGGATAGGADPSPVIEEIRAIGSGRQDDCLLIDDARLFNAPDWPRLLDVVLTLRECRPAHHVTVAHDLVIAVPERARPLVDAFARREEERTIRAAQAARLGPRRALVTRVSVHPWFVRALRALVWVKHRLT